MGFRHHRESHEGLLQRRPEHHDTRHHAEHHCKYTKGSPALHSFTPAFSPCQCQELASDRASSVVQEAWSEEEREWEACSSRTKTCADK